MEEKSNKSLKVLEPIQLDVKTFQDKSEFEMFYNSHKDEFESSTTTKLNRMYKIPGYRITRQKQQLCLKKDYTKGSGKGTVTEESSERFQELTDKVLELEETIAEETIAERCQIITDVSKLDTQLKALQAKIKKIEKVVNQQSESLNQLLQGT